MKKSLNVFLFAAFLSFLSFGCSTMQEEKTGTIILEGNATTGYSWTYTISPADGVVRYVSDKYTPNENKDGAAGVGGKHSFTFEAVAEGEAEIVFSYRREWQTDVAPEKTETYKAIVDSKNNLTLVEKGHS